MPWMDERSYGREWAYAQPRAKPSAPQISLKRSELSTATRRPRWALETVTTLWRLMAHVAFIPSLAEGCFYQERASWLDCGYNCGYAEMWNLAGTNQSATWVLAERGIDFLR